MIIGGGDIASVIKDRKNLLFFASGVSNSKEIRESEYQREVDLLLSQDSGCHIVYFSSLCVFYSDSRYAGHKRYMEKLAKGFRLWTILRFGNITWGTNPHTLINALREQRKRGGKPIIQDVYRYICDRREFDYWINLIPSWSCEMSIPGKRMKVKDIYREYVINYNS